MEAKRIASDDLMIPCMDCGEVQVIQHPRHITKSVKIIDGREVDNTAEARQKLPEKVRCVSCGSKHHIAKFKSAR